MEEQAKGSGTLFLLFLRLIPPPPPCGGNKDNAAFFKEQRQTDFQMEALLPGLLQRDSEASKTGSAPGVGNTILP